MKKFKDFPIAWKLAVIMILFLTLGLQDYLVITYCQNNQKQDILTVSIASENSIIGQNIYLLSTQLLDGEIDSKAELKEEREKYISNIRKLREGGFITLAINGENENVEIPAAKHKVLAAINENTEIWNQYISQVDKLMRLPMKVDTVIYADVVIDSLNIVTTERVDRVNNTAVEQAGFMIKDKSYDLVRSNRYLVETYIKENLKKQRIIDTALNALFIINCFIIAFGVYVIRKYIIKPINMMSDMAYRLSQGDISFKCDYQSKDEIGKALANVNTMSAKLESAAGFAEDITNNTFDSDYSASNDKDRLAMALLNMRQELVSIATQDKRRAWTSEGIAKFGDILRRQSDITLLSDELIQSLVKYIQANQAALYFLNEENKQEPCMEMISCYAWDRKKHLNQKIDIGQGLIGQVWIEKASVFLTEIPQGYIEITSGLGKANPTSIAVIPLLLNEQVYGVIEIASFNVFQPHEIEFLEKIGESIASTFATAATNQMTKILLEQSQQQAEELRAQEEEVRQNMEEMSAIQDESTRKAIDMQKLIIEYQERIQQLEEEVKALEQA